MKKYILASASYDSFGEEMMDEEELTKWKQFLKVCSIFSSFLWISFNE